MNLNKHNIIENNAPISTSQANLIPSNTVNVKITHNAPNQFATTIAPQPVKTENPSVQPAKTQVHRNGGNKRNNGPKPRVEPLRKIKKPETKYEPKPEYKPSLPDNKQLSKKKEELEKYVKESKKKKPCDKKLLEAHLKFVLKNSDVVIFWMDYDKAGESICFEIMDLIQNKLYDYDLAKNLFRVEFSSLNHLDIKVFARLNSILLSYNSILMDLKLA